MDRWSLKLWYNQSVSIKDNRFQDTQTCWNRQTWRVCCSWFLHVKSKLRIKFVYLLFIIFVCSPWFGYLMNSHGVDSKYPDFTKTKLLYNPAYHISWCSKQHIHELNNSPTTLHLVSHVTCSQTRLGSNSHESFRQELSFAQRHVNVAA